MTAPDIDDWDQPVAAVYDEYGCPVIAPYTGPERRHLDRTQRAEVFCHNGAYQVRAGDTTLDDSDWWAAVRAKFAHNALNGFNPEPAELRDQVLA